MLHLNSICATAIPPSKVSRESELEWVGVVDPESDVRSTREAPVVLVESEVYDFVVARLNAR